MSIDRVAGGEGPRPSPFGVGSLLVWAALVYAAYVLAYVTP
jgi:hypothetical protein